MYFLNIYKSPKCLMLKKHHFKIFMSNSHKIKSYLKGIPSNGDCFYQAVVEAFKMNGDDVKNYNNVVSMTDDEGALALRRTAAIAVTEEVFQEYKMYQQAGLEDFEFMSDIKTLEQLRELILVSGMNVGSKKCVWANEFEISAVCEALDVCCLILDMDARNHITSKYIKVGLSRKKFIVLHKHGEHYSLVYKKGKNNMDKGVMVLEDLTRRAIIDWKIEIEE